MRILAIDLGTKSLGLAITDINQKIVNPLKNFKYQSYNPTLMFQDLKKIVDIYKKEIGLIVLGIPISQFQNITWHTKIINFYKVIKSFYSGIEVKLENEAFTTKKAKSFLSENTDLNKNKISKIIDKMSAVEILNNYLKNK